MTQESNFPLQLEAVFFTRTIVIATPGYVPNPNSTEPLPPINFIDVKATPEKPARYVAKMQSSFNKDGDKRYPYLIDMECMAVFSAQLDLPEEDALRAATITGHHVTYGAIRETVLWLTSRQPHGSLTLGISVLKSANSEKAQSDHGSKPSDQ